jgi:quercetin dioxygenase-like cupin family protein
MAVALGSAQRARTVFRKPHQEGFAVKFLFAILVAIGVLAISTAACGETGLASSGSGATTTILGQRATLSDSVQINQDRVKFQTKDPTDVLVQTITFKPHGYSGWHFHPGIVIVVVQSGQVTTHDANCQTTTYSAHQSFVESGTTPFMVSNESDATDAVVYATIIVAAGDPFRIETDPPPCA